MISASPSSGTARRLVVAQVLILVASLLVPFGAWAYVTTDQQDYTPGSVVTISGDNRDGIGYVAGETVNVEVLGPNGYTASCEATADDAGAWSCQVTLWDSLDALGLYEYTATGLTSGASESGSFTDAFGLKRGSAAGSNAQVFARGETVYAVASPPGDAYDSIQFEVRNPSGTLVQTSACIDYTQGTAQSDSYTLPSNAPLSGSAGWEYRLEIWTATNTTCSGTANFTVNATFYVAQALAFANATDQAACTAEPCSNVVSSFAPGATMYMRVLGYAPSVTDINTAWYKPDGSTQACLNNALADRADSDTNGSFSVTYPEAGANGAGCPATTSATADGGTWQLWLGFNGQAATRQVKLNAFTVVTNQSPNAPTSLGQFREDTTTAIAVGGYTNQNAVVFKGTATDSDVGDTVKLQIELKPVATAFDGTTNLYSGTLAASPNGDTITVGTVGTPIAAGSYHWRARSVDASNATSAWVAFGGNNDVTSGNSDTDFIVDRTAPTVTISDTDTCTDAATCDSNTATDQTVSPNEDRVKVTWEANEGGTYKVVVGALCTASAPTGGVNANLTGTYATTDPDPVATIDQKDLAYGPNTITVCVTDAATNTGSEATTVWKQVPTTLTYNPPATPPVSPATFSLQATLAKAATSTKCSVEDKTIVFKANGTEVGTASTNSSGVATVTGLTLAPGVYDIHVEFAGTTEEGAANDDNCGPSADDGALAVVTADDAANGGGWYQLPIITGPSKRVSFGFTTRWDRKISAYRGQILVINNQAWRLKGEVTGFAKTQSTAPYKGELLVSATLFEWDHGTGTWETTGTAVTFKVSILDDGMSNKKSGAGGTKPDQFTVNWVKDGGVTITVEPLVESSLQALKGGNILIK